MNKRVYLFKLKLNTPYGLRVGGPKDDIYVLKPLEIEGYYVIPSSSWKGVFRRVTEVLFAGKDHYEGHKNGGTGGVDNLGELIKAKGLESNEEEKRRFIAMWNCPIERLYGSEYFASAVTFSDTLIDANINERTHTVIDRKTRKSKEKHLFREQIVDVKSVSVKVIVRGRLEEWFKTLEFMSVVGTFIGGSKSRGIGYAQLDLRESEYAEMDSLTRKPIFRPLSEVKL